MGLFGHVFAFAFGLRWTSGLDTRNKVESGAEKPHPSLTPKPGRMGHPIQKLEKRLGHPPSMGMASSSSVLIRSTVASQLKRRRQDRMRSRKDGQGPDPSQKPGNIRHPRQTLGKRRDRPPVSTREYLNYRKVPSNWFFRTRSSNCSQILATNVPSPENRSGSIELAKKVPVLAKRSDLKPPRALARCRHCRYTYGKARDTSSSIPI